MRMRGMGVALCGALVGGCCCHASPASGPAHANPVPPARPLPVPAPVASASDTLTRLWMRNVRFHIDDTVVLDVTTLSGTAHDTGGEHIVVMDDKRRLEFWLAYAEVGLTGRALSDLLNRYVVSYRGIHLSDLLDLRGAHGVSVSGDDLLLDPLAILPPPVIRGRLTGVSVRGDEVVEVFGAPDSAAALAPPVPARNFILFEGGSMRLGKLYMVHAELEAIDADASDPFDFYLDHYQNQLVAGYHRTLPDGGLAAWMPDFSDLGGPAAEPRDGGDTPAGP